MCVATVAQRSPSVTFLEPPPFITMPNKTAKFTCLSPIVGRLVKGMPLLWRNSDRFFRKLAPSCRRAPVGCIGRDIDWGT